MLKTYGSRRPLLLCMWLVACSQEGEEAPPVTTEEEEEPTQVNTEEPDKNESEEVEYTYEKLAEDLSESLCAGYMSHSAGNFVTEELQHLLGDETRCANYIREEFQHLTAATAGEINKDSVETCRRFLEEVADMDNNGSLTNACRNIVTGTVDEGGVCAHDVECIGDAYCEVEQEMCGGTCVARSPTGSLCDSANECQASAGVATCVNTCQPEVWRRDAEEDEACGWEYEGGDTLPVRTLCVGNLYCGDAEAEGRVCRKPLQPGTVCSLYDVCAEGACEEGVCVEQSVVREAGLACSEDNFCDPLQNLLCGTENTCESIGDGSEGSNCRVNHVWFDLSRLTCNSGLVCSPLTATCVAPKADGEPCEDGVECQSGFCDPSTLQCINGTEACQ